MSPSTLSTMGTDTRPRSPLLAALTASLLIHGVMAFQYLTSHSSASQASALPTLHLSLARAPAPAPEAPPQARVKPPQPTQALRPPVPRPARPLAPRPVQAAPRPRPASEPVPRPRQTARPRLDSVQANLPVTQPAAATQARLPAQAMPEPARFDEPAYLQRLLGHIEAYKHYPVKARRRHIEGSTRVHMRVDCDGQAQDLRVIDAHPLLRRAPLQAVQQAQPLPIPEGCPLQVSFLMNFELK